MIFLVLSILFSTSLFVGFKLFDRFKIDNLQAIGFNYVIAFIIGCISAPRTVTPTELLHEPWLYGVMFLGFLFVAIFLLMAITAQKVGVAIASVSNKMSIVIPVSVGIFYFGESYNFIKIIGILLAIIAVYLASMKGENSNIEKKYLILPFIMFVGAGTLDATLNLVQSDFVAKADLELYSSWIFAFAGIFSFLIFIVQIIKGTFCFRFKNMLAGFLLGLLNYYTIFFILKALQHKILESSTIFTINNVAVVVLTTLCGVLFFKEKLSIKNWIGIGLAIISILMVTII